MEPLSRDEIDRLMFFEQAREQAEKDYASNHQDTHALTRWGGALLELAHFRQGPEAYAMIQEATVKFKKALVLDSRKHDALWCLGNAYTSQGFLTTDTVRAHEFFDLANDCFKKAIAEDPTSDVYRKALEMTSKAPGLHAELQKQLREAQHKSPGGGSSERKVSTSDFWYDVAGWVCLAGIVTGWIALARTAAPATTPAVK
ncbi:hypothetical protein WJX81_005937 [Elliptochloris bilobata]|uniref:Mitochondrial import receptor subunit TOM20 n=1 Tax=Elliptochloris bilobata TaxID=381761 RepID=A0AAW1S700_9CHLO